MTAREVFHEHIVTHSEHTGFQMPPALQEYIVDMLASRVDRVDIIPEPSFGERYLQLYTQPRLYELKDYADSVLFFCSLLPEYGRRRGLDIDYYATLGISTYYALGDLAPDARFTQLGNWFYHLQRFIHSAIRPQVKLQLFDFAE